MASKFSATGIKPEGLLQKVRMVLPELPAPKQKRLKVPLGLKDAETISREGQRQTKQEEPSITRTAEITVCL
ncbi:hypothetical protein [Prochlorococcus marinus]|uniref:hypothetical protein n=1 Tax=Prochlorococcus marinus TaxID=1219 RepID=UPI00059E1242|nr:hypothetical protein [Prochlorococcus marinus]